jgi:cytochrome c oxidase subunit I+III
MPSSPISAPFVEAVARRPPDRGRRSAFERVWSEPPGLLGALRTINNVPIAHRYMVTAFAFFLVGGVLGLLLRLQLGTPESTVLDAATYNQIFTMHGTTMMFLFVIPFIEALTTYVLPLQLGTRDLPFPRLTALSYWTYLFGGIFLYSSFLFGLAPDGGWFAYVPLTGKTFSPGLGMDFWDIGLSVAEVAAMGAAAEMITGILRMRAPGMTLARLPLFAWSMLVTGVMIIFAFTPLVVGTALLELDRKLLTRFFDPAAGGKPLLWQHLFWMFGHPEVYIMFLPAAGIVSQVVQTFARRPVVGYRLMVLSMVGTGVLSFTLWIHHMFATGLSTLALGMTAAASLGIAVPSGIQVMGWLATLWTGRPVWRVPLLFVGGFLAIFVLGGLTGVMLAVVPFNLQAHDTHFVVGHFHYVLIGGVVFPLFAGLYYWLPKITGRRLDERFGRWNFWIMFAFFNITFFPMHVAGLLGMPRRVYTYPAGLGWEAPNLVSTVGAGGFAIGVLLFLVNVAWSARRGRAAGPDPWGGDTLEWIESSPPPSAQFPRVPVVRSRHPLWEQPDVEPHDPATSRLLAALDEAPTRWRGGLVVSPGAARPVAIVHLPAATIFPFVLSVGFTFLFAAALVDGVWLAGLGVLVSVVGVTGWFWPQASERLAIDEIGVTARDDRLPLAVVGPASNGWWGTMVLLLILATALATLVASYAYLGAGAGWPRTPPGGGGAAALGCLALAGTVGVVRWAVRGLGAERSGRRRAALAVALCLSLSFVGLASVAYRDTGVTPDTSAYGSIVLALFLFQWLVMALVLAMLGVAALWAWRAPADVRGHAALVNAALVTYFAVGAALVVFATIYLGPRLA